MRRSKFDIFYDMLKAIELKGGVIKPTHLLYKSNLSHSKMKEYIDILKVKELIFEEAQKKKKFYKITDKGYGFLREFQKVKEFTLAFGFE